MATLPEHEKDCEERLGEPFTEVHAWLDEFAKKFPVTIFEDQHRKFRHNKQGIEEIRKMWGEKASEAALLHIVRDEFENISDKYITLWNERFEMEKKMRVRKIIEINPPVSDGYKGLYRLSIKDEATGTIYPMDVTFKGLKVLLLEKQILEFCSADLVQNYKDAIIAEIEEGI